MLFNRYFLFIFLIGFSYRSFSCNFVDEESLGDNQKEFITFLQEKQKEFHGYDVEEGKKQEIDGFRTLGLLDNPEKIFVSGSRLCAPNYLSQSIIEA
jgi:hypothetical protein